MGKARRAPRSRKAQKEWIGLAQAVGLTVIVSFLFYRSIYGMIWAIGIVPFWLRIYRSNQKQKEAAEKNVEFKEFMLLVSTSIQAGYSVERALLVAEKELRQLIGAKSVLGKHIHYMNQRIGMNIPLEKAFLEFAEQIDVEDAKNLADILQFAKRSGGDYGRHIKNTAIKIEDKLLVAQEIDTMTSEKRLEFRIMSIMPLGILAYISIASYSFVAPLYHNALGVIIMSICLVIYGLMILLGRRLTWIKI